MWGGNEGSKSLLDNVRTVFRLLFTHLGSFTIGLSLGTEDGKDSSFAFLAEGYDINASLCDGGMTSCLGLFLANVIPEEEWSQENLTPAEAGERVEEWMREKCGELPPAVTLWIRFGPDKGARVTFPNKEGEKGAPRGTDWCSPPEVAMTNTTGPEAVGFPAAVTEAIKEAKTLRVTA